MNLGKMLVRMKVREWNRENVANGIMETISSVTFLFIHDRTHDSMAW